MMIRSLLQTPCSLALMVMVGTTVVLSWLAIFSGGYLLYHTCFTIYHIYNLLSIICGRYCVRGVARCAALRLLQSELLPCQEASQEGLHQDDPETSHLLKMKRRH